MLLESNKKKTQKKQLENNLDDFLGEEAKKQECVGDECIINDGKEIVERVNNNY
jgi:ferritin-like metal-binding protein YciE